MDTPQFSPIISIIVPIYNREKLLRNCLDSISCQTFKDWECILVNDGSTDNSLEIAQEYAANDERFIVFSQENQGVSAARNLGLDHAKGKWLAFVDSDDEIAPDYLEILHKLGEESNADMVNASYFSCNESGLIEPKIYKDSIYSFDEEDFENHFFCRISFIIKLFRHSIIKEHHLRFYTKLQYAEDYLFTLEFYLHAQRFASSSKAIYKYNKRGDNDDHLHKKKYDFQINLAKYNAYISLFKRMQERHTHWAHKLYEVLKLSMRVEELIEAIDIGTSSFIERYKMYRSIELPTKCPEPASMAQTIRYYLLYKQQYFLFALSRFWVNRH